MLAEALLSYPVLSVPDLEEPGRNRCEALEKPLRRHPTWRDVIRESVRLFVEV